MKKYTIEYYKIILFLVFILFVVSCSGKWGNGAYADFKIYGNITDTLGNGIANAKIYINQVDEKVVTPILNVSSDENGYFSCIKHNYSGKRTLRVVCIAPNEGFLSDSIDIVIKPTGGDGSWYEGTAACSCDFKLNNK